MSKKVGLVELVTAIGNDALFFQSLDKVATAYSQKKNLTCITFLTDAITTTQVMNGTTERLGLIVWLPRQRVKEILELGKDS